MKKLTPIKIPQSRKDYLNKVGCFKEKIEDVDVYKIVPQDINNKHNLIFTIHGGGFCKGHTEKDLYFASMIATETKSQVWDVDYKLAPKYPFPTAFNQVYDLIKYAYQNFDKLNIDPNRIILCGNSAGGNLAAAVVLKANKTKDFKIKLLNTNYPPLDLATDPADKVEANKTYIPFSKSREYNNWYANADESKSPYVSLVRATEDMLYGFPQLLMITGGQDALHNEGEEFAIKCMQAGVLVTIKKFEESEHSFMVNCLGNEWKAACKLVINTINNLD
ncbi:acetyl esterase [Lactobacillus colini]|uniref:Acetyl esterase n=1 Tax=Lactobacillus colini TaxID=1819254 RepID=A0ABS4MBR5_9LACO|nr:alpha/beta hydrolase [Lactobacillus colini]MBP2057123.1 acetyl esterase [Lactobacillus colini]